MQVRASVGLAPRCISSSTTAHLNKISTNGSKHETRNFSNSLMSIDADGCHDPDLRLYVLQRILQTWRQHSSGSSLVHAVSVLGWRRAIAAAGDVADVMEQHVQSLPPRAIASARQSAGHISSVGEGEAAARSKNPLNGGAGVAALFAARRRLMYVRGFMADFPTHMPHEARAGSSISIGAAASTNRVLGCIFVDWQGCALKLRRYRTIRVGTHSKVLDESRREEQRYLFRSLAAWHQLAAQKRAELRVAQVTTSFNPKLCRRKFNPSPSPFVCGLIACRGTTLPPGTARGNGSKFSSSQSRIGKKKTLTKERNNVYTCLYLSMLVYTCLYLNIVRGFH